MENTLTKENFDFNCNKLKLEFYKCIKSHKPNVGEEMRFMAKTKLNEIDKYKIDSKILNTCNNPQLVTCLNDKYRLKEIQEGPLTEIFAKEYDKIQEKLTRIKNNTDS